MLKSNGDGTFQAPQEYDIGPGQAGNLTAGNREIGVADFTNNGAKDVIVPNFRAADVSVLLDNGSGGFQPQRTFDAVTNPDSLVTGDFGNGEQDAAVLEDFYPGEISSWRSCSAAATVLLECRRCLPPSSRTAPTRW